MKNKIPTFVMNSKERPDKRQHILQEFEGKDEFKVKIINAIKHENGSIGLWKTILKIIRHANQHHLPYILICEDNHAFTKHYSKEILFDAIMKAQQWHMGVLSGGVSWFQSVLQISSNLFWIDYFSGLQFTVIFRDLYDKILFCDFQFENTTDYKILKLTDQKMVIYPFISIQKEFSDPDLPPLNNRKNHVDGFHKTNTRLRLLNKVAEHYGYIESIPVSSTILEETIIPTYIINLPERSDRLHHIRNQFKDKPEFDVHVVEACRHVIGAVGLWNSICKIIRMAKENDDDVIIICEDDHTFTQAYSKEYLLKSIINAFNRNADILNLGIGGFNQVVPTTENLYWVDNFWCTQFIVVYSSFFDAILSEPFSDTDTADGKLSEMSGNTFVTYPFISIQTEFGYSDITEINRVRGISTFFKQATEKFDKIHNTSLKIHHL